MNINQSRHYMVSYVFFVFQSLYAQSPSDVKQLLKIVLTSKGKLHGQDIAPRLASVQCYIHATRCVRLRALSLLDSLLFVSGPRCRTDSWMVQFTEFLQGFMTKVRLI